MRGSSWEKVPCPISREAQQFVGSEVQVLSDGEVCGHSRIRGGWNNGRAYTVYFYLVTDNPAIKTATWKAAIFRMPKINMTQEKRQVR